MAKIFTVGTLLPTPKLDITLEDVKEKRTSAKIQEYRVAQDKYLTDLAKILKEKGFNDPETGEVIDFPVADGKALYMVVTMKPLRLAHIALGDCWHFEYADKLNAKDVREKIAQKKSLNKLFGNKS